MMTLKYLCKIKNLACPEKYMLCKNCPLYKLVDLTPAQAGRNKGERYMELIKWTREKGQTLKLSEEEKRALIRGLREAKYLRPATITLDGLETEIKID